MTLGRTGEAYFVHEVEEELLEGQSVDEADFQGLVLNTRNFSDDEDEATSISMVEPSSTTAASQLPPLPPPPGSSVLKGSPIDALGVKESTRKKDVKRSASEPVLRKLGMATASPASSSFVQNRVESRAASPSDIIQRPENMVSEEAAQPAQEQHSRNREGRVIALGTAVNGEEKEGSTEKENDERKVPPAVVVAVSSARNADDDNNSDKQTSSEDKKEVKRVEKVAQDAAKRALDNNAKDGDSSVSSNALLGNGVLNAAAGAVEAARTKSGGNQAQGGSSETVSKTPLSTSRLDENSNQESIESHDADTSETQPQAVPSSALTHMLKPRIAEEKEEKAASEDTASAVPLSSVREAVVQESGTASLSQLPEVPKLPLPTSEDIERMAEDAAMSRSDSPAAVSDKANLPTRSSGNSSEEPTKQPPPSEIRSTKSTAAALGVDSVALKAALARVASNTGDIKSLAASLSASAMESSTSSSISQLELSMCWHLLHPDLTPDEILAIFEQHRINQENFLAAVNLSSSASSSDASPSTEQDQSTTHNSRIDLFSNPNLACRLGSRVLSFPDAQKLIIAALCFGNEAATALHGENFSKITTSYSLPLSHIPSHLIPTTTRVRNLPEGHSEDDSSNESPPLPEGATPRGSSWREWLSFSWKNSTGGSPRGPGSVSGGEATFSGGGGNNFINGATVGGGVPRSTSDASLSEGVPPEQEAALLAAAAQGQASHVEVSEIRSIRKSESGNRRQVLIRKRGFVPSTEHLKELADALHMGQNKVEFSFGKATLHSFIYFVRWDHRMIISDIDGTITKSDLLGHLGHILGYDWTHSGVTGLFAAAAANGYGLLFLSSRSIAQASITRDYLHSLEQDGATMPQGPVIISPDGLFPSLYREVVLRRPQEFKIRCLEDIKSLFPPTFHPFVAAFGNRDTDEISYLSVGVPASKIFIINPKGELRRASSAVVASSLRSLPAMGTLVDFLFPALKPAKKYYSPRVPATTTANAAAGGNKELNTTAGGNNGGEEDHEGNIMNGVGDSTDGEESRGNSARGTVAAAGGGGASWHAELGDGYGSPHGETLTREEYNDYNYWRVQPSYVIDDDGEFFEDALGDGIIAHGDSGDEEESLTSSSTEGDGPIDASTSIMSEATGVNNNLADDSTGDCDLQIGATDVLPESAQVKQDSHEKEIDAVCYGDKSSVVEI